VRPEDRDLRAQEVRLPPLWQVRSRRPRPLVLDDEEQHAREERAGRPEENATRSASGLLRISRRIAARPRGCPRRNRGRPRAWPGAAPRRRLSRQGRRSQASLSPKARRSAWYWSGSSFDRPGLNASSDTPRRFARARVLESMASAMRRTGGGRGRPEATWTTSNPPRNDEPDSEGRPRSTTRRKGRPSAESRSISLRAEGVRDVADVESSPARLSPTARRTSASSSTRRTAGPAGGAEGTSSSSGSSSSARSPSSGAARDGSSPGVAKDAWRAAVASRRSSSSLRARSSIISSGLMPWGSRSAERSRPPSCVGTSSVRLKANSPSRRRTSRSMMEAMRWRTTSSRAGPSGASSSKSGGTSHT
jgi:hypothetical protein